METITDRTLTPQQQSAVDMLAGGNTITDTAQTISVTRQTVSEWYNHSWTFRAALNARRQEIWREQSDRLRALVPQALDVFERDLATDGERSLRAAVGVLRAVGMSGLGKPIGKTNADEIEADDFFRKISLDERKRNHVE